MQRLAAPIHLYSLVFKMYPEWYPTLRLLGCGLLGVGAGGEGMKKSMMCDITFMGKPYAVHDMWEVGAWPRSV